VADALHVSLGSALVIRSHEGLRERDV